MAVTDDEYLGGFIALAAEDQQRQEQAITQLHDVGVVTGFAGRRIRVQSLNGGAEAELPAFAHVVAAVGDEVMVQRFAAGWIVIGNLSGRVPVE